MNSIVYNIQKDIIDSTQNVSDILRQTYILARKLKVKDFENWIYSELNGYKKQSDIPDYRYTKCTIKGWNRFQGWIPVIIQDKKTQDQLTIKYISQGIPELEDLLKNQSGVLHQEFPDSFGDLTGHYTKYIAEISFNSVKGVIEKVKNIIMEWILKIEEDGIIGEDMYFTEEEKSIADKKQYTVNNFYGDVNGSQIQQNSNGSSQTINNEEMNIELLKEIIELLGANKAELLKIIKDPERFISECSTIESEGSKDKPSKIIIKQALITLRNMLEGIAGNIIAAGILYKIGSFI